MHRFPFDSFRLNQNHAELVMVYVILLVQRYHYIDYFKSNTKQELNVHMEKIKN